ncbi:uncharacterized protein LOC116195911 [Punica granatum]|uniref:Uncharacterized protein LOC116195911 n=1 Tax=Punica granatum TaxID=22663 RepID=A0A6P8CBH7_PUNGR|nr:uncharacterized protein LOC116195911 [Punica granatum]
MAIASALSMKGHFLSCSPLPISSPASSNTSVPSHLSPSSSSSSAPAKKAHHLKLRTSSVIPRASSEGGSIPAELIEDSKFVPLNVEDPQYGPPALLFLGFELEEVPKIKLLLKEMDGEFLQIIYCTEDMINRSLWEAVHIRQSDLNQVKIAKQLPRICFLSGLSGEEMMMFIDAFPETGLEPAVFAALVPNSADKPLQELIEEIMGDHETLTGNQPGSQ